MLADPFCGALAVFKSWHGAAETAARACARLEAFQEGDELRADHETDAASLPLRRERVTENENVPESVSQTHRRAPEEGAVAETTEAPETRGSSSAFAARFRDLASWRCGDRVSWTRRASFHRRRGLLAASGGAFFRKDALDPYETPLGLVDRKKKMAASEAFSLSSRDDDDDDENGVDGGAKDETLKTSMVDHRRLGFVFEPPALAADAAFARFVAHRARFCAVLLPSDWLQDDAAPWRAEAWARLKRRGACAVVPTLSRKTTLDDDDDDDDAVEPRSDETETEGCRDEQKQKRAEDEASARADALPDGIAARRKKGEEEREKEKGGDDDVSGAKRAYAWLVVFRDAQARESACPDEKFWEV